MLNQRSPSLCRSVYFFNRFIVLLIKLFFEQPLHTRTFRHLWSRPLPIICYNCCGCGSKVIHVYRRWNILLYIVLSTFTFWYWMVYGLEFLVEEVPFFPRWSLVLFILKQFLSKAIYLFHHFVLRKSSGCIRRNCYSF